MVFKGQITHLSQKGLGVVQNKQDGIAYFVSGTWPGDHGEFEIIDRTLPNKKYGYAKLVQLIQPSVDRQQAPCPFLGTTETACAGCPWMIASYTSQLEQKRNRFKYALQRAGFNLESLSIPPFILHPCSMATVIASNSKRMVINLASLQKAPTGLHRFRIASFSMKLAKRYCINCTTNYPEAIGSRLKALIGTLLT